MKKTNKRNNASCPDDKKNCVLHIIGVNFIILVALLGLMEGLIAVLLNYPPPFTPILRVLSSYYTDHDRVVAQALPECAVYDPELSYLLRPGSCQFNNYDFESTINVNSLGTRDDEASLEQPRIIVLGDSFTMGWGVAGNEAYPQLVEKGCGMRTLNAGVSSYGTVRELKLLGRVDVSRLETLLIQYTDNDLEENRLYAERGNKLVIMSESEFVSMQNEHVEWIKYYPGRHIIHFVPFVADRISKRLDDNAHVPAGKITQNKMLVAARHFLNVLETSDNLHPDLRIIAYRINGRDKNNGEFARAIIEAKKLKKYTEPVASIEVADFTDGLTRDKFFVLDDHISATGHDYIARELMRQLGCV